jgi:glycosyltransferase involved in cell wall biosynthesis
MLTVGLPFFNSEKTLANAIKSVLIQSFTNWELILIDDGSNDNSLNIAIEFAKKDDRIKLISDGINRGLIFRLNQIIDLAQGEYIARMDSDDMMMKEKLEKQMNILLQNKQIDVIDTAAYIINETDQPVGVRGMDDISPNDKKKVLLQALLFHPTVIAKSSWYKKNKYSEDYFRGEDWELWCRTCGHTNFHRLKEPLYLYREGNINVKNYIASMKIYRKIIKHYGPGTISAARCGAEMLKSYLKSWAYYVSSRFNLQYLLAAARNSKLNDKQVKQIEKMIVEIKAYGTDN